MNERFGAGHIAVPLGAALCLLPWTSPAMGLVGGLAIALALGNPYLARTRALTPKLLSLSIIGLGAGMDLRVVARVGLHGIGYTLTGIVGCLLLATVLARLLKVPRNTAALIGVGTAICGGSAIAAMVPVLEPEEHEVSVALGTVFLLNAAALVLFPAIGHALALSQPQFGLWSALAIHDTSSVVGAAVAYGAQAAEIATPVKLARALWIVPLTFAAAAWKRHTTRTEARAKPKRPWFIAGFLAAAALVTFVPMLEPAGKLVARGARQMLVLTLFLIGANLTRSAVKAVGPRPFAMGVSLWLAVGGLTLWAIAAQVIG
jgi:uncharacterized integral membrane protein (TIGR00698 family)